MSKSKIVIFLIFILMFTSIYYFIVPLKQSEESLVFILFLTLLSYIAFFSVKIKNKEKKNQYLTLRNLFLLSYTIVFFQNYIDLLFNYTSWNHGLSIVFPNVVCKSACISLSGFISFSLGYLVYKGGKTKKYVKFKNIPLVYLKIFTSIIFFLIVVNIDFNYINGGYGEVEINGSLGFFIYLFESLVYAILIIYSLNKVNYKKTFYKYILELGWFNIIVMIYLLGVIFSGDRGPIIYTFLLYISTYIYSSKNIISLKKIVVILFLGGFFMTILGVVRNVTSAKKDKIEQVSIALQIIGMKEKNSLFLPTKELANSVRTLHAVVNESQKKMNFYTYGYYQSYQLATCLPLTSSFYKTIGLYDDKYVISSDYITWLLQGDDPDYGDGTSCNADLFLDFGYFGVCIGLFLFGLYCRKVDIVFLGNNTSSLFFCITMFVYFTFSISLARNPILFPIKKAVMVYLICLLYNQVLNLKSKI